MKHLIYAVCAIALLSGCAQVKKTAPKEGREAVQISHQTQRIEKSADKITLSQPQVIHSWHFASANQQNKIPHAAISGFDKKIWDENVGHGVSSSYIHLPKPVMHEGMIYTLDSRLRLTKTTANGDVIWDLNIREDENIPAVASVGLAFDNGLVYVVSGDGVVYAIKPEGEIIWQYDTKNILRSAPVIKDGHLYVLAANNELFVINTKDGSIAWTYKNIETDTNLLGMGNPAIAHGVAVVPFSSGEIIAFDDKTGQILWSNTLLSYRTFNQIADLSHVLAAPVIDGGVVYLIGNAHQMGAFRLKTGEEIFTTPIGGQTTPVIVGDALFMITNKDTLVAMNKYNGRLIWEKELYSKTEKRVSWHMPVPINNQIVATSSEGDVIVFDMLTGTETKKLKMEKLFVSPTAYNNGLLFYTDDADLIMYR
ncbi:MAG: PQQ-like beta-propeller repeat protein [Alphaproteobacteria bacterium]|nr:PQQ-like beta-propeller repeat protein [Alphaproteobacteria bacterium]